MPLPAAMAAADLDALVGGMLALGALAAPATVNVLEAGDVFSERLTTSLLLLNLGGGLSLIYWEARERIA